MIYTYKKWISTHLGLKLCISVPSNVFLVPKLMNRVIQSEWGVMENREREALWLKHFGE